MLAKNTATALMTQGRIQLQGAIAAFTCAACFIIGAVTLKWIAPDIYVFPEGRLRVIEQYGVLLHVWHFIIFPLVGLSVLFLNRTLVKQTTRPLGGFSTLCTLVAYVALCHDIAMFTIETLSNELFLQQHFESHQQLTQQTMTIYSVLIKLRASTEWGIDVWLCLMNVYLLFQRRFHPILQILGIAVGVLGVLVLFNSSFHYLEFTYLSGMIIWFLSVGTWQAIANPPSTHSDTQGT